MEEMDIDIAKAVNRDCSFEVRQLIQLGLLSLPVETTLPVTHQALNVCEGGTQIPARFIQLKVSAEDHRKQHHSEARRGAGICATHLVWKSC